MSSNPTTDPSKPESQPASALSSSTSTSSHNPFHIGSLPDLSLSRSISSLRSESQEKEKETSQEKEKRRSKRRSLINAGRSLSPFRLHGRSSSRSRGKKEDQVEESEREKEDLTASIITVKGGDDSDKKSVKSVDESDTESRKWSSRLCPRNNAFSSFEQEEEEESDFTPRPRPVRKGTGWSSSAPASVGKEGGQKSGVVAGKVTANENNDSTSINSSGLELPKESSESSLRPSMDSERSVDTNDSSIQSTEESEKEKDRDSDQDSESTSSEISFDPELLDNTLFNAGCLDLHGAWQAGGTTSSRPSSIVGGEMERGDSSDHHSIAGGPVDHLINDDCQDGLEAPNVVLPSAPLNSHSIVNEINDNAPARTRSPNPNQNKSSTSSEEKSTAALQALSKENKQLQDPSHALTASRPFFERNRCTITLIHGEYEKKAETSKRPKRYIVASDGSEEASYAIEWCIGTVLRDGDETLIVSVMETDTKLDAIDPAHEDRTAKMEHQKVRQSMALVLARQATALLQRTRLGVKISCQALHSKNARHMLLDMIDFFAPTLVIVGSRGLSALKGILLGSTSHYLVQKSSVPVMVARKRLKLPALPRVRRDVVESVRARHMRLDEAAIEKESKVEDKVDEEGNQTKNGSASGNENENDEDGEKGQGDEMRKENQGQNEQEKGEKGPTPSGKIDEKVQGATSPEQIAQRASDEENPISPPLEESNSKSLIHPPLDHNISSSPEESKNGLHPSLSNDDDSVSESVTHLTQDEETPQRGRSLKAAKE